MQSENVPRGDITATLSSSVRGRAPQLPVNLKGRKHNFGLLLTAAQSQDFTARVSAARLTAKLLLATQPEVIFSFVGFFFLAACDQESKVGGRAKIKFYSTTSQLERLGLFCDT